MRNPRGAILCLFPTLFLPPLLLYALYFCHHFLLNISPSLSTSHVLLHLTSHIRSFPSLHALFISFISFYLLLPPTHSIPPVLLPLFSPRTPSLSLAPGRPSIKLAHPSHSRDSQASSPHTNGATQPVLGHHVGTDWAYPTYPPLPWLLDREPGCLCVEEGRE